jgi:hypothetical protein
MQSIRDILDSTLTTGFSYFYGIGDDYGYLRRMCQSAPSLEAIYARLKYDIEFINETDEDFFRMPSQYKALKKLRKYLDEARKYVKKQMDKKKRGSKWEKEQIDKELRTLERDKREGLIDEADYDHALKMLLRPSTNNLDEVKSKFEEIDGRVKQELKQFGYEEENLDAPVDADWDIQESKEEYTPNIDKLVDDNDRRYTMGEFTDLYEIMNQQTAVNPQQQAMLDKKRELALKKEVDPSMIDRRAKLPPEKQALEIKNIVTRLKNGGWSDAEIANFVKGNAFTKSS